MAWFVIGWAEAEPTACWLPQPAFRRAWAALLGHSATCRLLVCLLAHSFTVIGHFILLQSLYGSLRFLSAISLVGWWVLCIGLVCKTSLAPGMQELHFMVTSLFFEADEPACLSVKRAYCCMPSISTVVMCVGDAAVLVRRCTMYDSSVLVMGRFEIQWMTVFLLDSIFQFGLADCDAVALKHHESEMSD